MVSSSPAARLEPSSESSRDCRAELACSVRLLIAAQSPEIRYLFERVSSALSCRGTASPFAAYCESLFLSVRIDTPSERADAVRFPLLMESVSRTRSFPISRMPEATSQRAMRRRDARDIVADDACLMAQLR